jgi:transposase
MAKPLSVDLRDRMLAAVAAGATRAAVAERFGVVSSTVTKIVTRVRRTGSTAAAAMGGDRRSRTIEQYADEILALIEARRDITLDEIAAVIETRHGRRFAPSVIWRLLDRRGLTFKKKRARQRADPA